MARQRRGRNPFRGLVDVTSEMARMSDRMAGLDTGHGQQTQPRSYIDAWTPSTDILARGDDLVARVELPGVAREDVDIAFSHGTLTLSGQREADESDDTVYYTKERSWGRFRRDITLPEGVDSDEITAEFDQGLLEITIRGGATATGPGQIPVTARR